MPDLYFDEDVREPQARASFERALEALRRLKQEPVSVAVFSDLTVSGMPRRAFFQRLALHADRVIRIEQQSDQRLTFLGEKARPPLR